MIDLFLPQLLPQRGYEGSQAGKMLCLLPTSLTQGEAPRVIGCGAPDVEEISMLPPSRLLCAVRIGAKMVGS